MAPHLNHHPMQAAELPAAVAAARRRAIAAHPAGRARTASDHGGRVLAGAAAHTPVVDAAAHPPVTDAVSRVRDQEGAMAAEYGMLIVVGATIASLVVRWASGGAVFRLLDDVLRSAGRLLGL
jgi:Flp pilus assembly pilin Flp